MEKIRVLTGITTSGTPHLGNYVGAIRPAIAQSRDAKKQSYFFLADYHALIKCTDPTIVQRSTLEIAATWLALGLDPATVFFYRQSDVPEVLELTWFLTCVAGKGLLNRAHAYKAAVDINRALNADPDAGVSMGLYMYPVLMAADILLFNAHQVPVGKDQVQHIEIARDVAMRFNHVYATNVFVAPEAMVDDNVSVLPGLDGRKMSKSYGNTIPLWLDENALRKAINGVLTNTLEPGQAKSTQDSHLFALYQAFATPAQVEKMRAEFAAGIAWGEVKRLVAEQINAELAPARQRYEQLIADPAAIEKILADGAARARSHCAPLLARLRACVGIRPLSIPIVTAKKTVFATEASLPKLQQYREKDGQFYFKLSAADGTLWLQSVAFADPKACGKVVTALKNYSAESLRIIDEDETLLLQFDGHTVAHGSGVRPEAIIVGLRDLALQNA
jgi:tryptophanyl-tRNA synthetase